MQPIKATSALLALFFSTVLCGLADEELVARVKSDRVNLRARPESAAEVVLQVNQDERLHVLEVQDSWVRVTPPERVDLWVHRDFVKEGLSVAEKVNIRAGAGINFSVVGQYTRGERIEVRGQFGEWLKVSPANASLWVSRDLVDVVAPVRSPEQSEIPVVATPLAPPPPAEPIAAAPSSAEAPSVQPAAPVTPAAGDGIAQGAPRDLKLVPLEGQGRLVQREGEIKSAAFSFGRPSKFRLARREGSQYVTICYLRGNSKQLESLLNERLIVSGREYWVQGVKQSVLVLERIERPLR